MCKFVSLQYFCFGKTVAKIIVIQLPWALGKLTEHFAQIRLIASAASMMPDNDVSPSSGSTSELCATSINYPVHSFLKDEESENLLLSKIADLLVLFLLPIQYTSCIATRPALCQVLAKKLFRPAIEYLTSPSSINQFILGWLHRDEADNTVTNDDDTNTNDTRVQLNVAGYEFYGQAELPQQAKHNAATQVSCLRNLK